MFLNRLIVLNLCFILTVSLYSPNGPVVMLNKDNFDKEVIQSDDIWLVEFFANWCGKKYKK